MHLDDDLKPAEGTLRLFLQDPVTNRILASRVRKNVITYTAADVLAKAIAGEEGYKITHIYFQHNTQVVFPLENVVVAAAAATDDMSNLTDGPSVTTDAEVAIQTYGFNYTPDIPGRYSHNIVTFTAVTGNTALDDEVIIGAGLIVTVGNNEFLFAHQYTPTLIKLPQTQLVGSWSIRFL